MTLIEYYLLIVFILIISAFVGSFLNVVIYRLPIMLQRQWHQQCTELLAQIPQQANDRFNLSLPRSHCPNCKKNIAWYDNVPLLSYLWLRGRCRHCRKPISIRYFLVELLTVLLSVVLILVNGTVSWTLLPLLLFTWLLLAITFIDFDCQIIPDGLNYALLWLGLLLSIMPFWSYTHANDAIIGAVSGYVLLWVIANTFQYLTAKEGMGQGDFKLLAATLAWTGWQLLPFVVILSSVLALIYGGFIMIKKRRFRNVLIPFGPFLASSAWLTLLFQKDILTAYRHYLGWP